MFTNLNIWNKCCKVFLKPLQLKNWRLLDGQETTHGQHLICWYANFIDYLLSFFVSWLTGNWRSSSIQILRWSVREPRVSLGALCRELFESIARLFWYRFSCATGRERNHSDFHLANILNWLKGLCHGDIARVKTVLKLYDSMPSPNTQNSSKKWHCLAYLQTTATSMIILILGDYFGPFKSKREQKSKLTDKNKQNNKNNKVRGEGCYFVVFRFMQNNSNRIS